MSALRLARGTERVLPTCGLHLFAQPGLPTRQEWEQKPRSSTAPVPPTIKGVAQVIHGLSFPAARNTAGIAALILLASMFLPDWGVFIKREVTQDFDVIRTTEGANAWQYFQRQDLVMTTAALLALAILIVSVSQPKPSRSPNVLPVMLGFLNRAKRETSAGLPLHGRLRLDLHSGRQGDPLWLRCRAGRR